MWIHRVGEHALLLECVPPFDQPEHVVRLYGALRHRADEFGFTDVVPAARTVLLDGLAEPDRVAQVLEPLLDGLVSTVPAPQLGAVRLDPPAGSTIIEVPVVYDGPDLDEVARQWELSTAEVIALHTATTWQVQFCGFAPGFGYCTGLGERYAVRRRRIPRTSVPAGAVALAGNYCGIYPQASPGGWQIIGTTGLRIWRPEEPDPALLAPGRRVRFTDG